MPDGFKKTRKKGKEYEVESILLNDLLVKYNAPKLINYLSIDIQEVVSITLCPSSNSTNITPQQAGERYIAG